MIERSSIMSIPVEQQTAQFLAELIVRGKQGFTNHYGLEPNEVSLPITCLPAWRDLVEIHRIGPWHNVTEHLGMKVAYNTETWADDGPDNGLPVLVFRRRAIER